jgi:cell fate regulator YaaT (PSP1 superfamily)
MDEIKNEQDVQNEQLAQNDKIVKEETEIIGIRFKPAGKIYYFSPAGIQFEQAEKAIVETVRGVEYGTVAIENRFISVDELVSPLKPVIRKATPEDEIQYQKNKQLEDSARDVWEEKVKKNGLVMQLVDVEYTFDNAKLIFYFTADGRVDFRELVKDLASVFKTRIELRQIGVRDEAKLFGGLGVCGRPFCCKTFLSDFVQVSIKMAKEQNLSLSSTKISGTCGRLMCCLRYEHEVYEKEYADFPKVDSIVETPAGRGVVIESNFLTGNIKVKMNGEQGLIKNFTKNDLKVVGVIRVKDEDYEELKKLEE